MTSPVELLTIVHLYDYVSYIIVTAVGYDYILTFTKEIEYVWSKPWTRMSTLFVLARYPGMFSVILEFCRERFRKGNLIFIVGAWCYWIFLCSADFVMILRLWALYTRSKFVLGTLLTLYVIEAITFFICYLSSDVQFPRHPIMNTTEVLGSTACVSKISRVWFVLQMATQVTLGAWMCLLIVIQYIKESVHMHKLTKRFGLGAYQKLLMREGLVYFIATLGFGLDSLLVTFGIVPAGGWQVLASVIQQTLCFTLFPRLVMSLRRLHMRDLEGRRGSHIDTAFGFN